MNRGIIYALSAYIFWGLHPIYWKLLKNVPSEEIVAHRVFWSLVFFAVIIFYQKNWNDLFNKIKSTKNKWIIFAPAFLIGSNWAMYIWAINAGFVIETSLGYFISPLFSVLLGVVFLKERLRKLQYAAITIAAAGVILMTAVYGQFPWISLYLAGTWSLYGLLRKQSPMGPVEGLAVETLMLSFIAIAFHIYLFSAGKASFGINIRTSMLLAGTGLISGLPLIIYIKGAKLIKLSLIGILQYIYPTLIFLLGYFVYNESLTQAKITGFAFIWAAITVYIIDGNMTRRE